MLAFGFFLVVEPEACYSPWPIANLADCTARLNPPFEKLSTGQFDTTRHIHGMIIIMNEIKRISAGVVFESDVLQFIDQIASDQQRHRSFIINQIIRHYARIEQQKPQALEAQPIKPVNGKEVRIKT